LAAYVIASGQSLIEVAMSDPEAAKVGDYLLSDEVSCTIRPDMVRELLYERCSDEDAARATTLLVPQPLVGFTTPVRLTRERFGQIPKFYIQCLQDRTVPPSLQRRMSLATHCEKIFSLDTDHSAFLSAPDDLAAQLLEISS
ncbi:MAG: hypothetical protein M3Y57_11730, partial [Acidobacteriota bacterium]|nr:hypothetical protein [Acidobacteriota bacterium]